MWGKSHLCGQSLLHGHHETDNVTEMKSRWLKSFRYVRLSFQGMLRTRNRLWPIQIGAPSGFSFSDNPESSIWLEVIDVDCYPSHSGWEHLVGQSVSFLFLHLQLVHLVQAIGFKTQHLLFLRLYRWQARVQINGEARNSTYFLLSCL